MLRHNSNSCSISIDAWLSRKCGNVTIPYPFGIGSRCSVNSSFTIRCQNSTSPPKPFSSNLKLEVENISLYGVLIVKQPVSPINCSDGARTESLPILLEGSPFTISAHYNSLVVMGCKNSVWLLGNETTIGGCMAVCDVNSTDSSCNGVNCCQITIPRRLQQIEFTYENSYANCSFCGYVFPADKKWLQSEGCKRYEGLLAVPSNPFDQEFRFALLALAWEFGIITKSSIVDCINSEAYRPTFSYHSIISRPTKSEIYGSQYPDHYCINYPDDYRCQLLLDTYANEFNKLFYYNRYDYVSSSKYCDCRDGFDGNPYLREGCSDIDECSYETNCRYGETCINTIGGFSCDNQNNHRSQYDHRRYYGDNYKGVNYGFRGIMKRASIVIGSVLGGLILLAEVWKFSKAIGILMKLFKASHKYMFFKQNGGLLLEQQLAVIENGIEKTRLFSSIELSKATDDYNETRVHGRGGEGVVYKGMLEDGRIVAVKKLERVNQGDVESFINEVVIVSQINHRNVVKLLGCCLESEVPRLVYEFIPNSTLFHHIHDPHKNFLLFWEMRVRIAKEIARALAYLHYAASVPSITETSSPHTAR